MHREDASDLTAFLAVARERSFTRAAAELNLTQGAISRQIRVLEKLPRNAAGKVAKLELRKMAEEEAPA